MLTPARGGGHVALVGTTASGKSAVALAVAQAMPEFEIVSVDSMQVYRGMDIGTAKPTRAERAEVAHHLLDLVDPWEPFDVATFQDAFGAALRTIEQRGHRALLVGGTGLYHRAVVDDLDLPGQYPAVRADLENEPDVALLYASLKRLDPGAAGRMEPTNRRRILRALEVTLGSDRPFSSFGPGLENYPPSRFTLLGLASPPAVAAARIGRRLVRQMDDGFLDEVRALTRLPRPLSRTAAQALGYRELLAHLGGELSLVEAVDLIERRTRQFARRQRAWFRRDPRITWLEVGDDPVAALPRVVDHVVKGREAVERPVGD